MNLNAHTGLKNVTIIYYIDVLIVIFHNTVWFKRILIAIFHIVIICVY